MWSSGKQAPSCAAAPQNSPWLQVQRKRASVFPWHILAYPWDTPPLTPLISNNSWRLRFLRHLFPNAVFVRIIRKFRKYAACIIGLQGGGKKRGNGRRLLWKTTTYNSSLSPLFRALPIVLTCVIIPTPSVSSTILLCSRFVGLNSQQSNRLQSISL